MKHHSNTRVWVTANHQIRAAEVRVLDEKGGQLGVMTTKEAIERARIAEKDLVLIADKAQPPVAKIINISKYKYQQQQKDAESRKKAKAQDIKEVRFTPFMSDGDFDSRLKKVETFLKRGDKVRLSLQFKGRQITKKEFGFNMFTRVITATDDIATLEMEPKMLGKKLIAQLQPVSNKEVKKQQPAIVTGNQDDQEK